MTELASVTKDRSYEDCAEAVTDDDKIVELHHYIVSPDPLPDSRFDEGVGD